MTSTWVDSIGVGEDPPTKAPQASTVVEVATSAPSVTANIFTETLQGILGFTSTQVWVLVDNGYDSQESVIYWKFTDIKDWCQLKAKIPASRSGVYYGDRKIKWLQALDWCVTYLTLWGKIVNLNNFKTDILADSIADIRQPNRTNYLQEIILKLSAKKIINIYFKLSYNIQRQLQQSLTSTVLLTSTKYFFFKFCFLLL